MKHGQNKYTARSATAVIVANMIGTGVFASLGFQLLNIQSGFVLLLLWFVGGLTALFGALSYAELGAALPRSGGEYHFLSKIYHPMVGFVAGWVSTTIGFAAPVAVVSILFAGYFTQVYPFINQVTLAVMLIVALTAIHISNHKNSGGFHQLMTLFKLVVIVGFCLFAISMVDTPQKITFSPDSTDIKIIFGSSFAVALIYVNYAYMGWNSATYLSSEIDNPQVNLPKILVTGTLLVTILYVSLNFVFLYVAPIDEMVGVKEIAYVAATHVFGSQGAKIMSLSLAVVLISTVSAMTMAGPRAFQAIGEDYPLFNYLARTNSHNIPVFAIILQSSLSVFFVLTSSFEFILVFAGFTLGISNFATVLGVIVLRYRQPDLPRPYKSWMYPLPQVLYLLLMGWTLYYIIVEKTQEAIMSFAVIALGILMYFVSNLFKK